MLNAEHQERIEKQLETARKFSELGTTGLEHTGGFVYEEFLSSLRNSRGRKIFRQMSKNDPVVGSILYMVEQLIRRASWKVVPASDSEKDMEVAKFLEECMDDMEFSWNDTISEILSFLVYGWSFHEIVYKKREGRNRSKRKNSKYDDGKIGWRKIARRSQHTLDQWIIEDNGDITAMIQVAPPHYRSVTIPLSKGILFRTKLENNNPEGVSLLRNAYRPWYFKKHIEELEGVGIERDAVGLPVLTLPDGINIWDDNNPEAAKIRRFAQAMVRNVKMDKSMGLVLPNNWDFKLVTSGGKKQFDTNEIINRYDQRIAITLLSDVVMLGSDRVGSFALASVKKSLLAASVESIASIIASVFNSQAVPALIDINGFSDYTDYPKIQPNEIETPSLEELANFLKAVPLLANQISTDTELANYLRQIASMPQLTPEQEKKMKEKEEKEESEEVVPETTDNSEGGDMNAELDTNTVRDSS